MSYAQIRDKIKELLEAVEGIGVVRTFRRHSIFLKEILKDHTEGGRVNSWEITRTAVGQEIRAVQGLGGSEPYFKDTHEILITGWFGLSDKGESELLFQDLIDEIREKIRQNNQIGRLVLIPTFAQVPVIEHRMIGSTLVHYVEIGYAANEEAGGF